MASVLLSIVCIALLCAGVASSTYTVVEQEYSTGVPGLEGHSVVILEGDGAGEPQPIAELQTLEATGETATSMLSLLACVVVTPFAWFDKQVELFQELETDLVPDAVVEEAVSNDGIPSTEAKSAEQLLQQLKIARMQDALNDYAAMQDRLWSLFDNTAANEGTLELETLYSTIEGSELDGDEDAESLSDFSQLLHVLSGNSSEDVESALSEQVDEAQEGFELVLETLLSSEDEEQNDTASSGYSQLQFELDDEDYELSNIEGTTSLEKLVLHLAAISAAAGAAAYSDNTVAASQHVEGPSAEVVNNMSWAVYSSDGALNTSLIVFVVLCIGCIGMAIGFVVTLVQLQRTVSAKVGDCSACRDVEPGLTAPLMAAKGYQQHKLEHVEVAADYISLPTSKH